MKRKLILGLALTLAVTSITGCQAFKKKEVKTATELLKEYNKKDHKNYDAEMVVSVKLEENNGGQISNIDYNVNSQITRTKGYGHGNLSTVMNYNSDENAKTYVAFYKLSGRGGAEIDESEAVRLLEEQEKKRDSDAMWMLGLCCEYGRGTRQDIPRAMSLYQQSSRAGNAVGKFLTKNEEERGVGMMRIKKDKSTPEVSDVMRKRLGDLICVAPWTSLDLGCSYQEHC